MSGYPQLIGMTGRARTGKDTVAGMLVNYGYQRVAFADPIRDALRAMLGSAVFDAMLAEKEQAHPALGKTYRELAQTLGTEWGRDVVDGDWWLTVAAARLPTEGRVVFSDVRFENEAKFIKERGGVVWHIERLTAPIVREHVSEAGVDFCQRDVRVENDGTLEELKAKLSDLMSGYRSWGLR